MSICSTIQHLNIHRDVVPAYFVRSAKKWIVTGVTSNLAGAVVIDEQGDVLAVFPSKRDALASIIKN